MNRLKLTLTRRDERRLVEALRQGKDPVLKRRALAMRLLSRGMALDQVAEYLAASPQSVYAWTWRYGPDHDLERLRDRARSGRPRRCDALLEAQVAAWMAEGAAGHTDWSEDWTVPLLQAALEREVHVGLADETIRRCLRRLGYGWKRGKYVLDPDPELLKKTPYPVEDPPLAALDGALGRG
jgi:transposase